ncbi:B12-binding domain-containing radical SAM protein [Elusimicrobiota bacterium]
MKNIILFQPAIGYMDAMRTSPSVPLSLLCAASVVTKYYKVNIIDQRIDKDWTEVLEKAITDDTVCAGVTGLTGAMLKEGLKFSKYIKKNHQIPVVWGGVHSTLLPEQTASDENVDIVIEGEGELAFYEVVKALDEGAPLNNISGIYYKEGNTPVYTGRRDFCDMDELPEVPYDLLDISKYLPAYKKQRSIYFQSSRGCPYRCKYCYNNSVNRGKWRALSAEKTLERIGKLLDKFKFIDDIYFVDDNFFIDMNRAEKIIRGLKEIDVTWQVQGVDIVSIKRMDDSFLELLRDSGCQRLTVGIESGSPKIRELIHKNGSVEDIAAVMERLKKYDIIIYCSFLIGIPGETIDDIKCSIDLLLKLMKINPNIRNSPFYIYTPYPGTELYERVTELGFKAPGSIEEWADCEWDRVTFTGNEKFYHNLHFTSLFIDKKTREYSVPLIVRILTDIYRPVARCRIKKLFFGLMIEKYVFKLIKSKKNEDLID